MRGECSAMRFSPARLPFSRPENEASRREPKQSRMPAEKILFSEDAIGQVEYCAKVGPNFARENSRGSGGSNPPPSPPTSPSPFAIRPKMIEICACAANFTQLVAAENAQNGGFS